MEGKGFPPEADQPLAEKNLSRSLRRNQTEAEKRLWRSLRSRELNGCKFRRQQPIGPYIVDFCCLERRLVIEVDGGQHAMLKETDERRTAFLEKEGFRVVRFWDNEVLKNTVGVLETIAERLGSPPSPPPSPLGGEGDNLYPIVFNNSS
jgi:very-short-patch-repair endonuclease